MSQAGSYNGGGGAGGDITTLTGNTGGAVGPTSGNINIVGTGGISVAGNPSTHTLTISSSGGGGGITTLAGDTGSATGSTVTLTTNPSVNFGTLSFSGTGSTLTLNTTNSNETVALGTFSSGAFTASVLVGMTAGGSTGTGAQCVGIGFDALGSLAGGTGNVAIGFESLAALLTGNYNTSIGYHSGVSYTGAESSNVIIGNAGVAAESNVIRIGTEGTGNAQQNTCFIAGIANSTVTGSPVLVDVTTGQLGLAVSSKRFKTNITDMADRSSKAMNLRPVNFSYKEDVSNSMQFGLIAEEVAEVMPEIVTYDASGVAHTVRYHEMPAILLNELQKLSKRVSELELLLQEMGE